MISSALPLPTNSAASGALRLQVRRATGVQARGLREQAEFLEFAVEMGQPEIDADENDGAFLAGISSDKRIRNWEKARRQSRRALRDQAAASSFSAAEKLTARPGTMVEMACL